MEKMKVLVHEWSYPVCSQPFHLKFNIEAALNEVCIRSMGNNYKKVQFIGIGTSGALLLGALAGRITWENYFDFILLRKPEDTTSQGKSDSYTTLNKNYPIIIIDDHICEGDTIREVSDQLQAQDCLDNVIGVIARTWMESNPEYSKLSQHEKLLPELFPKIKFWLY
jgi:orotate phosphoribosyltransferase-like protein